MNRTGSLLRAYTLIEVLMVMAIIAIVSMIVITSFFSGRVTQALDSASREVAGVFREAQNYALTGYQGVVGTDPCGYVVTWGGGTYTIRYKYKVSGTCSSAVILRTYTLKNGVSFGGGDSFEFSLPHANLSFSGSKRAVLSRSGSSRVVCMYATGRIENFTGAVCP